MTGAGSLQWTLGPMKRDMGEWRDLGEILADPMRPLVGPLVRPPTLVRPQRNGVSLGSHRFTWTQGGTTGIRGATQMGLWRLVAITPIKCAVDTLSGCVLSNTVRRGQYN